jgi:hypothetical protein
MYTFYPRLKIKYQITGNKKKYKPRDKIVLMKH